MGARFSGAFSLKYFDGIPCSKKQILRAIVISHLILAIPYFALGVLSIILMKLNVTKIDDFTYLEASQWLIASLLGGMIYKLSKLLHSINYPRQMTDKALNPKDFSFNEFFKSIKLSVLSLISYSLLLFSVAIFFLLFDEIGVQEPTLWWMGGILIFAYLYRRTWSLWIDERLSYPSFNRQKKLFYKSSGAALSATLVFFFFIGNTESFSTDETVYMKKMIRELSEDGKTAASVIIDPKNNPEVLFNIKSELFYHSIRSGNEDALKVFLSDEKMIDSNHYGQSPLQYAVQLGRTQAIDLFIKAGLDYKTGQGTDKITPLMLAAKSCEAGSIESLAAAKADLNAVDVKGNTALHYAAKEDCLIGMIALHKNGADLKIKNSKKRTPRKILWRKYNSSDKEFSYYLSNYSKYLRGVASE